ncbi:MAG: threonine/serine exporter ThrE family protein [Oscillospiraceae bacterium]
MTDKEVIEFAINIGLSLLENGAETQRVEDTTKRIVSYWLHDDVEVIALLTNVTISTNKITRSVRVKSRTINLNKVCKINQLSRDIAEKKLSFYEANIQFQKISSEKTYPFIIKTIAVGSCCGFFTLLFGGNIFDALNGFITGIVLNCVKEYLFKYNITSFLVTLIGGGIVSLLVLIISKCGLGNNIDNIIIGSIMPLVPGIGITNALRDLSEGDYLSGGARFFDALITTIAVSTGAGSIIQIWSYFNL